MKRILFFVTIFFCCFSINAIAGIAASSTSPTKCGGSDGLIIITGLVVSTHYTITYKKDGKNKKGGSVKSDATGTLTIEHLSRGTYASIEVTPDGNATAIPVLGTYILADPGNCSDVSDADRLRDSIHYIFRLGANFDFLHSSISFNDVYGEFKYSNENILQTVKAKKFDFGFELGGSNSNTISSVINNYTTAKNYIDPAYSNADSFKVISQNIKGTQSIGFNQLSLFVNPSLVYNVTENFRIGVGGYAEMYRVTSNITYSDTSIINTSSNTVPKGTSFMPVNFQDSMGSTNTYGYFGPSLFLSIYSPDVVAKFKAVVGWVITGAGDNFYTITERFFPGTKKNFYLINACITEPKSKISIQANVRGLFPNETPLWGVYASKIFDLEKIFDAVTQ